MCLCDEEQNKLKNLPRKLNLLHILVPISMELANEIQSPITHATYLNTAITNVLCAINTLPSSNSIFNLTACTL
jgi:hypothetical protein